MEENHKKPVFWTDLREITRRVIFEADTRLGKLFDMLLIYSIILSIVVVMLDSVEFIKKDWGYHLNIAEWGFTIIFSVEYVLRLICVKKPLMYARSFYGVIDLLSIIPTYASLILPQTRFLLAIRSMRLLRIFRVLKLVKFINESDLIISALYESRRKITVFLATVAILVIILGSLMYVIEGGEHGYSSIPKSIYWAIVTMTTVGYGDISPKTPLGQMLASIVMIMGYGIIAVPTGIVTAEFAKQSSRQITTKACHVCSAEVHDFHAQYCYNCGEKLLKQTEKV
ncbi:MAG: ion transporter [Deltaproteobacteria bacterium]|nr:ion transporter [Deltaproteobacteria bacterium]